MELNPEDEESKNSEEMLVNNDALELLKDGRAKVLYLNEGNNNIAVLFKIIDDELSKDSEVSEFLDNKVFRIKKKIKTKYLGKAPEPWGCVDDSIISNELTYSRLVRNYIVPNDADLNKFVKEDYEITMSKDMADYINEEIAEARGEMIAEARKNYPLKTFQNIDMTLRHATIMDSLSSEYWVHPSGTVKHIELKFGLIVQKPMQESFIHYLEETYSPEQLEAANWFKNVSRFTAKQASLFIKGKQDQVCMFNPLDIVSHEQARIRDSLIEIFKTGTGYAKVFKQGKQYQVTEHDIEILTLILQNSDIFDVVQKYQSLTSEDLDVIESTYKEIIAADTNWHEHIMRYFENFKERLAMVPKPPKSIKYEKILQEKWNVILDWIGKLPSNSTIFVPHLRPSFSNRSNFNEFPNLVAESFKDTSIMVKWVDYGPVNETMMDNFELLDIQLIDLDTKLVTKIPSYQKEILEYFKNYAQYYFRET